MGIVDWLKDSLDRLRTEAEYRAERMSEPFQDEEDFEGEEPMEPDLSGLVAPRAEQRVSALASLGEHLGGSDEVRRGVFRAMTDVDAEVATAAVGQLDRALPNWRTDHVSEAAHEIVTGVSSGRPDVAKRCIGWLEELGDAWRPALRAALQNCDQDTGILWLVRALAILGIRDDDEARILGIQLQSGSGLVRDEAAAILAGAGGLADAAGTELGQGLLDWRIAVRRDCARALGHSRCGADHLHSLTRLLTDRESEVREAAATALTLVGAPAVPIVASLLETRAARRAAAAHEIMAELSSWARATPALVLPGIDPLGAQRNVGHYLRGLMARSPEPMFRAAVRVLGGIGEPAAVCVETLVGLVEADPDPELRQLAVMALGDIGAPAERQLARLAGALLDPDPDVRSAARGALPRVASRWASHDGVERPLRSALKGLDDPRRLEDIALTCVVAGEPCVALLLEVLATGPRVARQQAATILGRLGSAARPAVQGLEEVVGDEDTHSFVRREAAAALEQILGAASAEEA